MRVAGRCSWMVQQGRLLPRLHDSILPTAVAGPPKDCGMRPIHNAASCPSKRIAAASAAGRTVGVVHNCFAAGHSRAKYDGVQHRADGALSRNDSLVALQVRSWHALQTRAHCGGRWQVDACVHTAQAALRGARCFVPTIMVCRDALPHPAERRGSLTCPAWAVNPGRSTKRSRTGKPVVIQAKGSF